MFEGKKEHDMHTTRAKKNLLIRVIRKTQNERCLSLNKAAAIKLMGWMKKKFVKQQVWSGAKYKVCGRLINFSVVPQ